MPAAESDTLSYVSRVQLHVNHHDGRTVCSKKTRPSILTTKRINFFAGMMACKSMEITKSKVLCYRKSKQILASSEYSNFPVCLHRYAQTEFVQAVRRSGTVFGFLTKCNAAACSRINSHSRFYCLLRLDRSRPEARTSRYVLTCCRLQGEKNSEKNPQSSWRCVLVTWIEMSNFCCDFFVVF